MKRFAALLILGLAFHGCSSLKGGEDSSSSRQDKNFQSAAAAEPIAVAADVSTDLYEQSDLGVKKGQKPFTPEVQVQKAAGLNSPTANLSKADEIKVAEGVEKAAQPNGLHPHSGKTISYTVKSGDTFMKIAFKTLGSLYRWREIYNDNKTKVRKFNALPRGTVLTIHLSGVVQVHRNGTPYLIKRGDTLARISSWVYGTISKWKDLWHNNLELIHDPHWIYAGFHLYYREGSKTLGEVPKTTKAPIATDASPSADRQPAAETAPEPTASPVPVS